MLNHSNIARKIVEANKFMTRCSSLRNKFSCEKIAKFVCVIDMTSATTDVSPVSAQEQDTPVMSKLLAGPTRRKRAYSAGVVGMVDPFDIKEESGIMMVPLDDQMGESTTQDDLQHPKVKRSARKCKWYVHMYFDSLYYNALGAIISLGVRRTYVPAMVEGGDATAASLHEDLVTCV